MNYFAHGMRFTDRPYFLAGTAVPDWLSVADRRVRMRPRRVAKFVEGETCDSNPRDASNPRDFGNPGDFSAKSNASLVAAGVMQHLEDDRWFHKTRAFLETSDELTRMFRGLLGPEDGFRPGFLGHLVTELLLDGVLIQQNPHLIDGYYAALHEVDPEVVQRAVNRMARHETTHLAAMIALFRREQFLRDYPDPGRLLDRLNQVMRRVKLKQLPDETRTLLASGWRIVKDRAGELLPPNAFQGIPP